MGSVFCDGRGSVGARGARRSRQLVLAALLCLAACAKQPSRIELTTLADGEWIVAGAGNGGALLMQTHAASTQPAEPRRRRMDPPAARPFAWLEDSLENITTESVPLRLADTGLEIVHARGVYFSPLSPPQLVQSPVDDNRYVFERGDAIWLFAAPDTVIKLTTDDDVVRLRGLQSEGEVIVYWSTDPIWSADGRYVVFVSNREAVRGSAQGQSMWLIDMQSRAQRPLLARDRESVRAQGALGEEILYSSDREPGVLAVQPATGATRSLSDGFVLGAHEKGTGAAIGVGDPESRVVWLHRADSARVLPMPGSGFMWSTQARFSPSGKRLALFATDGVGSYKLYVFDDQWKEPLSIDLPGGPTYGPVWINEASLVFVSASIRESLRTWLARLK